MENESLRALNERLMQERETQPQQTTTMLFEVPSDLTPPPSECEGSERAASPAMSSMSSSDCSLVDSRSFESAEESGSRVGRIVDGGDGDTGSGGLLPGVGCPDLADIEQYLMAAGGAEHLQQGGGIKPSIATKEEAPSSSLR